MSDEDPSPGDKDPAVVNIRVPLDVVDLEPPPTGPPVDLHRARVQFTWFVLGIFGATMLASLASVFVGEEEAMLSLLERLLPAQTAVVGSTLGFYFISNKRDP